MENFMADLRNAFGILGALASPTFTYAPEDIQIILHSATPDGTEFEHLVAGFAEGTFLQITKDEQVFSTPNQITMDGRTQRIIKPLQSTYTIAITLTQTSISNLALQQLFARDVQSTFNTNSSANYAKQSISIKDQKSVMLLGPVPVWIEQQPTVAYASNLETRQWVLKAFVSGQNLQIRGNQAEFEFTGLLGGVVGGVTGLLGL
jgi:hypothetical protein